MTSYIFSVIDKRILWNKVYDILSAKYTEFEMIFAVKKECKEYADLLKLEKKRSNVKILTFAEESENQMLTAAIKECSGENLILCRDYFDYTTILSDLLLTMGDMGVQVAMFRTPVKPNKFKIFFRKIYNKIIEFVFGFKLYEGDIGLMFFNNIALSVLKQLPNNVTFTKVNKFVGFEIGYIDSDDLKKPKIQKKQLKYSRVWLCVFAAAFVLLLTAFVLLIVFELIKFVVGLLIMFFVIMALFGTIYFALKLSLNLKLGDLN